MNGHSAANDYSGFFDRSLSGTSKNELGQNMSRSLYWTGSNDDGTKYDNQWVGSLDLVRYGNINEGLDFAGASFIHRYRLLALSPVFKVLAHGTPYVSNLVLISRPIDRNYLTGDTIKVAVDFSEAVTVDSSNGTPQVTLSIGATARDAAYAATESTGSRLVFGYRVVDEDQDEDGLSIPVRALNLNGGTISKRGEDIEASLFYLGLSDQSAHRVNVRPTGVTLAVSPEEVAEDGLAATVTVTARLNGNVTLRNGTDVTVQVGASEDTATEGTDYAEVSNFTVTIPANQLEGTGTFELALMNDDIAEGSETVSVKGTATGFAVTDASVTLTDDETAPTQVALSVEPESVAEGVAATVTTVTATLEGNATLPEATQVTVSVGALDDTATEGTDYAEVSDFTVTIPGGMLEGTGTFELTPTQDTVAEGAETLSVAGEATGFTVTGTTVRLTDDEAVPMQVALSVKPGVVAEGDTATTVTVTATLEGDATLPEATQVTVSVGALDDTATEGTDYQVVSDFTVTIPALSAMGTGTFSLSPTNDVVAEGDEAISVTGSTTAVGLTVTGTTVRLTDDEAPPTHVTLSVEPGAVAEGDTTTTVTATLEGGATLPEATQVTVSVGASADTATEGTDYAEVSDFTVTIPALSATGTGTFSLSPTNDVVAEGGEAISVTGSTTAVGLTTVTGTTVRLTDDETAPTHVTLSVEPGAVAEGDAATTVTVTATLEGGATLPEATQVTVSVGASADTATEGTDYAEVSDFTVTIPAEQLEGMGTFELTPTQDTVAEGAETLSVAGEATGFTVTGTTVRLTDDEAAPTQVALSVKPGAVVESDMATTVTVTATLEGDATLPEATQVTVSVGALDDTATEGTDYQMVSDFTVTIPGGMLEGTGTFELTPTQDTVAEGAETLSVEGEATGFTVTGTTVRLTDDETAPTHVTLSVEPESVAEGDAATTVTVTATLEGGATLPEATQVTVSVGELDDTATEGTDYQMVSDFTVTIPGGMLEGTGTFELTPTQDTVAEGAETLSVEGEATGFTVTGTTVRLTDDETAPTHVTLSVEPESVAEGDAATTVTVTVTVTLEGGATLASATEVTVQVGASEDTATEGTDYGAVSDFAVTILAKQLEGTGTFELAPMNDDIAEGSETVSVKGTVTGFAVTDASVTLTDDEAAPTHVTLSVEPASVAEGDAATTVTVTATLEGGATLPEATQVTVSVGALGDTATEGTDYQMVSDFTVTIPALSATGTGTFSLSPTNDVVVEGDEAISVTGSTTAVGLTVTGTTVRLTDDETAPMEVALSVEPGAVAEGDTATTVMVTATLEGGATLPEATQVTVSVGALDDTATEGTDYAEVSDFTVTIPGGMLEGTGTFELTPTQDTVAEGAETLSVEGEATGFTVTGTTVRLTDDEAVPMQVALSVEPESVAEGDVATTVTVTATLEGNATLPEATQVTVSVGALDDTATEGTDYQMVSDFTVTIPALSATGTGTFSLSPTNDVVAEGDEAISVTGSTTAVGLTVTGTTVRLTDDETAPTQVALSVKPDSVAEGDTATTVTVTATLEGGATLPEATQVTVSVGELDDTATEGTDYQMVSDFTVTIPGGMLEGTGTFELTPTQDTVAEGAETLSVEGEATGFTVTGTTVRLTDDETAPTHVTLSVEPESVAEGDAATTVTVTVTLEGGATLASATEVTVQVGASEDTATEGTDYGTVSDFAVTILAKQLEGTGTFELAPMNDDIAEGSETVSVKGTVTGFAVTDASVTLTDDEAAPTHVTLSVEPASVAEGDAATTVTVTATLEGGATLPEATQVTVSVGALDDTATEGTDYQMVSDFTVTIPALSATGTGTFSLSPTNDVVAEGDEAISVTGSTTAVGLTVTGTTVRLTDDETAPMEVALSVEPGAVAEGDTATTVMVTATLEGGATLPEATQVTVSVGALDDTATEGTDYAEVSDFTVTIPGGMLEGTGTFELTPTQDTVAEGAETLSVEGEATGFTVTGTTVRLTDDEAAPMQVTLSVEPGAVAEGDTATTVTVTATLEGGATLPEATQVTVSVGALDDTATEGTDYQMVSDFTVTIPGGMLEGTGTFELTPTQDTVAEGAETLSVEGEATGFTVTGTTVRLTDDETAPTQVALSVEPESVAEGDAATTVTVTVTLEGGATLASATEVTVQVGASEDTATEGTDYGAVSDFAVTILAKQLEGTGTFELAPMNDDIAEGSETVSVKGTVTGFAVTDASVTLTDDEAAPTHVTLSVEPASVAEGDAATTVTVTATLEGGATLPEATQVTVSVGALGDTATEGTDYQMVSDFTVTIPALSATGTGTFSLSPTNDVVVEGDEAISVTGSTTAVGLTVTGTTVRLTDDETAPMEVALSVEPGAVAEGDTATTVTVTATLEGGATLPEATQVTVSVGASGDTATEGTDYAEVSDFTVTIPALSAMGTGTFSLSPTNDVVAEGDEAISVTGSTTAVGLTVTGTTVRLTDDEAPPTHVTLSVEPGAVAEGDAATTVTVTATLEGDATLPEATQVTVSVGASADTATEGTDYAEVSDFTVTIPAKQLEGMGTFELTPTQDTVAEGTETLSVEGEATGFTVTGTTVRLTDDETAPMEVALSVEPGAVAEGDTATTVMVTATLEGGATLPEATQVTVSVGASGDTASEGTDYAEVSDFTVTIPALSAMGTGTFSLSPTNDVVAEGDEAISVTGSTTAVGLTVTGTTVRLTDDEAAPTHVALSVEPESVAEGDAATTVTVTATLEGNATLPEATQVTVSVGASADTATEGTDYAEVSDFTVTIPAKQLEGMGTFELTPTQDTVAEGAETLSVAGEATGFTVTGTTVRLTDDETTPTHVTLSVEPGAVAEGDTTTTVTVTATLEGDATLPEATQVTVSVGASADTATEGTDYAEVSDFTVTIPAKQLEGMGTFELTPTQDTVAEGAETLSVAGEATGFTVTGTTVRLTDDETAPTQVALSVKPDSVAEGDTATTVTVTATLEGGATLPEATQVTVSVGASADTATEGTDYAEVSDFTVTIPAKQLEGMGTFELTPTQDTVAEGAETLSVAGEATGFTVTGTTVRLTDDEAVPMQVALSVEPDSVAEGDTATTVTVTATLEGGATLPEATQVTVSVGALDDTATEGTDYAEVSDFTVTIPAKQLEGMGTFELTPTQDTVAEGAETLSVAGEATGFTVTGTTVRLTDDETAPTQVALSVKPDSVAEGDTATTVTVTATLEGGATLPEATQVTVSVGALDDTATEGTDYQMVSDFTVTIPGGMLEGTGTFELAPMNDDIAEGSETVSVTGLTRLRQYLRKYGGPDPTKSIP